MTQACNPRAGETEKQGHLGSLTNQPRLLGKLQASERLPKRGGKYV